jgi:hypothetical protein
MKKKEIKKLAQKLKADLDLCFEIEKEYLYYLIFDETFKGTTISVADKNKIVEAAVELEEE